MKDNARSTDFSSIIAFGRSQIVATVLEKVMNIG